LFEHADHNLHRNGDSNSDQRSRFVDGYIELMADWLRAQATQRQRYARW
jgi:hypothetical protein